MSIPSSAIASANREVQNALEKAQERSKSKKQGPYYVFTAKQRAEIGKYAKEHGICAAKEKYSSVLGIHLNESTTWSWVQGQIPTRTFKETRCTSLGFAPEKMK